MGVDLEGDGQREVECEGENLYSEHLLTWGHPPMTQHLTSRQGHLISCWPGSLLVGHENNLQQMRQKCHNCLGEVWREESEGHVCTGLL